MTESRTPFYRRVCSEVAASNVFGAYISVRDFGW